MEHRKRRVQPLKTSIIEPDKYGVSFSIKQCRNFTIDPRLCLDFLISIGFRRFRLMSYWDEHEQQPGEYNFAELDMQIDQIKRSSGVITLCLGARQPRWPESHWPQWSLKLPETERNEALLRYIQTVVTRYKDDPVIISYQLENEFLNRSFGLNGDFNRQRVRQEFKLLSSLDPTRPVIMTTSNTYGLPVRQPRPHQFGFTLYQVQHEGGTYTRNKLPIIWWRIRAKLIYLLTKKPSFIHELQTEPWGPKAIWEMPVREQNRSMDAALIAHSIQLANKTGLYPIDLWGGEWWYWRHIHGDAKIAHTVRQQLTEV